MTWGGYGIRGFLTAEKAPRDIEASAKIQELTRGNSLSSDASNSVTGAASLNVVVGCLLFLVDRVERNLVLRFKV